jgi:signal transduction histidine kinase
MTGRTSAPPSTDLGVVCAELFASLDLDETAATVAALAASCFSAERAGLYLLSGSAVRHAAAVAGGDEAPRLARVPRQLAQRLRRAAELRGTTRDPDEPSAFLLTLRGAERAVGVVQLGGVRGEPDAATCDGFAQLAGTAIAHALSFGAAQQRAERLADLERSKSQFLNLASHELRGPLTVLMGYLSLVEDGAFGEVPAEFAATLPAINARVAEMESLINAMLDTARLEDDRLELNLADEDLSELAAEAVDRAASFVQPGQELRLARPHGRVPVNVDRGRIVMAIGNLISNAIKYSVDHTDVDCAVRLADDEAVFCVTDRGIGIAQNELPALFQRFGRIRSDPAVRVISGTGLGLFLAREIVRAHGGDITVESTAGAGSTFTLTLPAAR